MKIARKELAEAVLGVLEKSSPEKAAQSVAAYLISERRSGELNSLLRDLEELRYQKEGVLEVTATSAFPLSANTKRQIENLFESKEVKLNEEIDKRLIGGVKVRALDKVADFSVVARLRRLRLGGKT